MERASVGSTEKFWRWAIGFESEDSCIAIYNNSHVPLKGSLCFSLSCLTEDAVVVLRDTAGHSLSFHLVAGSELPVVYDIELKEGKNDFIFSYVGEKHQLVTDDRELKFCISNLAVIADDGASLCSSLSAYSLHIASVDKEARTRIHQAVFYAISAEIIDNKGFYRKQMPNSSFSILGEDIFMEDDYSNIIRESAKTLGKLDVLVVYKCYRKCFPGELNI